MTTVPLSTPLQYSWVFPVLSTISLAISECPFSSVLSAFIRKLLSFLQTQSSLLARYFVCVYMFQSNPWSTCPVTAQTGSLETTVTRCGREWEEGEVVLQDVDTQSYLNHFHYNVLRVSQHSRTKSPQGGRREWEEERKQRKGRKTL